jgi:hypothetical protein
LGVIALSLRLIGGWVEVQGMKRRHHYLAADEWQARCSALACKLGVSRPVKLLESTLAEVPLVIGWLRPVVLLPASLITGLTREQIEALLAHELAHVRRHDYLVNLFQCVVETVLFYHPVVWWISKHIREERENACDDLAIDTCGNRLAYARTLTVLEEMRRSPMTLAPAASGGSLLLRIRRLLGLSAPRQPLPCWLMAGSVAALIAFAAMVSLFAPARALGDRQDPVPQGGEEVDGIAWGEPSNGLRAGISYRKERSPFKHDSAVGLLFTVENVSSQTIAFSYPQELNGAADGLWIMDSTGKDFRHRLRIGDSTGRGLVALGARSDYPVRHRRITLPPGEKITVGTAEFVIRPAGTRIRESKANFSAGPGKYRLANVRTIQESEGGDWTGKLTTGVLDMIIADVSPPIGGANEDSSALLERAKSETNPDAKSQAIRELGDLAHEPASGLFSESLRDPNASVRAEAAQALLSLKAPSPGRIIMALEQETDSSVIQQLLLALESWREWKALPSIKRAAGHPNEQTRISVLRTIGKIGDSGDVNFLSRHLNDASALVGSAAAEAIQAITGEAFDALHPHSSTDLAVYLQKAREWWKANQAKYEAADNEGMIYVTAQLSGTAYEEALAAEKSGRSRQKEPDAQPDPKLMRGALKPYEDGAIHFGRLQFYVTEITPEEAYQKHFGVPNFSPSELASETLGATITLTAHRRQGRILFSGKCVIPRLEAETPFGTSTELVSSSTVTRAARFTGAADPEKPVRIDLSDKAGTSQLTLTFSTTPPR